MAHDEAHLRKVGASRHAPATLRRWFGLARYGVNVRGDEIREEARRNTRGRFEQWAKNPTCDANTSSAVHNIRLAHAPVTGDDVVDTFRAADDVHGAPASTLTDNGLVFITRFLHGPNGFERELVILGMADVAHDEQTPRRRPRCECGIDRIRVRGSGRNERGLCPAYVCRYPWWLNSEVSGMRNGRAVAELPMVIRARDSQPGGYEKQRWDQRHSNDSTCNEH